MDPAFQHGEIRIAGVALHWAELPAADPSSARTPVVLLHGMMDSHLTWKSVAPLLARDRRVLMPDLVGCGLSSRPDACYSLDWHTDVIARWLDAMALNEVDIVGHSFGGGIAQMLLLACPERIRRITLVASGGLGRDVGFWLKLGTFPKMVEYFGQPFMAFGTRRAVGGPGGSSSNADVEALTAMNRRPGTARAFSRTVRSVINFGGQYKMFTQRAGEVERFPPIRVFWGDDDRLIPLAHARALVAATEGVQLEVFRGCGHYLHQQEPAGFAAAVLRFLDDATAPRAALRELPLAPVVKPARPVTTLLRHTRTLMRRARVAGKHSPATRHAR